MPSTPSLPLSTAGVAIVIFNLPIWLKAVDIKKQVNINVSARLGGFYQLKSYLGLMGNIMQDSLLLLFSSRTSVRVKLGLFNAKIRNENHRYIHRLIYQLNEQDLLCHSI